MVVRLGLTVLCGAALLLLLACGGDASDSTGDGDAADRTRTPAGDATARRPTASATPDTRPTEPPVRDGPSPPAPGVPSPQAGAVTPAVPPPAGEIAVAAPIDELEMIVRESAPPQYAVRIVSGLPDGCHLFHQARIVERASQAIRIEVLNRRPGADDVACTQVYGQVETIVELGTDFTPGATYVVDVNGRELTFTAQ
jgi:hypothetical protein